jgi:hypothetical protein
MIPQRAKLALIDFDAEIEVRPHKYTFIATRGTKIQKLTRAQQDYKNKMRKQRRDAGFSEKDTPRRSLRSRITGMGAGV